jgi:hypothetical protein
VTDRSDLSRNAVELKGLGNGVAALRWRPDRRRAPGGESYR